MSPLLVQKKEEGLKCCSIVFVLGIITEEEYEGMGVELFN